MVLSKIMENKEELLKIENDVEKAVLEILNNHPSDSDGIFVLGCSSSEIAGGVIGHNSSEEIGKAVFKGAKKACDSKNVYLACQCCEHLNRALVVSKECMNKFNLEQVSVVPWLKGGGSLATAAYNETDNSAVVEFVKASWGLDIGGTLIGMHLKHVAVPLRLSISKIGNAFVNAAYTRPKLIGGERARYQ